jgi:hypothetical protein
MRDSISKVIVAGLAVFATAVSAAVTTTSAWAAGTFQSGGSGGMGGFHSGGSGGLGGFHSGGVGGFQGARPGGFGGLQGGGAAVRPGGFGAVQGARPGGFGGLQGGGAAVRPGGFGAVQGARPGGLGAFQGGGMAVRPGGVGGLSGIPPGGLGGFHAGGMAVQSGAGLGGSHNDGVGAWHGPGAGWRSAGGWRGGFHGDGWRWHGGYWRHGHWHGGWWGPAIVAGVAVGALATYIPIGAATITAAGHTSRFMTFMATTSASSTSTPAPINCLADEAARYGNCDRSSRARVDLAPALPADRAHNRPALVRREERRANFAPLHPMREILIGDVGLRLLGFGGERLIGRGNQFDADSGGREVLKQIAPRHFRRI